MDILKRRGKPISPILPKNRLKFWPSIFLAASILLFLPASNAHPAQVTLAWDASTDPDIAGYKVYYGNSSGSHQEVIDVGNTTTCTISTLLDGTIYYFAATDYNTSGIESGYSNEVVYNPPPACTYSISPATQSFDSSGGPGTVSVTASSGCIWTAVSNASWITISSNSSVTGNGTVNYSVPANSGTTSRTGTLTIAGKTFTVIQSSSSPSSGSWTFCANQGELCSFTGTQNVRYGANGVYFFKTLTNGTMCSSSVFGNPLPGVGKQCYIQGSGTFTITASADSNGFISPPGTVTVNSGATQTFIITPNTGYQISDVRVDGASVGSPSSYNFTNVTASHTIQATFAPLSYSLTVAKAGTGTGTITTSPPGTSFNAGTVVTLTATPDAGSTFAGWSGGCSGTSTICTVTINSNTSVTPTFMLNTYTITALAEDNGSISPSGTVAVSNGASQSFTITPAWGYRIDDLQVDGVSVGRTSTYSFGNVTANHTINASFRRWWWGW